MWPLLRPLLFLFDPERVHEWTMRLFVLLHRLPGVSTWQARRNRSFGPQLKTRVASLELDAPIGLAAGFDKNARWYRELGTLGFGFVEVGTLTAHAQPGNPKPRLFRLPADRAIINRFGFNNEGSAAAAERLTRDHAGPTLGINIGRSKITPNEEAVDDYLLSLERLWPFARYVVVNVSSPNTAGLRDLQEREPLAKLLGALAERNRELATQHGGPRPPLFVKIAPDLEDEGIDAIIELVEELNLDGIVATNTTIGRAGLRTPEAHVQAIGAGGLSGAPLTERSRAVVRRIYERSDGRIPIIGVGGIMSADDVWELLRAGASAVQVYTGFIYGGPDFVRGLHRDLQQRMKREGLSSLSELIGSATRPR